MRRSILSAALALTVATMVPGAIMAPNVAFAGILFPKESQVGGFVSSAPKEWGINEPSCVPTGKVKEPVVLIHGTSDNASKWKDAVPVLKGAGMCLWAFDYGAEDKTLQDVLPRFKAIGDLDASAREVAAQIEYVREVTGSQKVNLVGHSQGGTHTKSYEQMYGTSNSVARVVAIGGNYHGTTLSGLAEGTADALAASKLPSYLASTASIQQIAGSEFFTKLNALPDTSAGVMYTSIYSPADTTVTPNSTSHLVPVAGSDVVNMNIQDVCGAAPQHARMPNNQVMISQIVWGLTRDFGEQPNPDSCAVNASPLASLPSSPALPTADLPALGSF